MPTQLGIHHRASAYVTRQVKLAQAALKARISILQMACAIANVRFLNLTVVKMQPLTRQLALATAQLKPLNVFHAMVSLSGTPKAVSASVT
jgi:hypothetical protein